MRIFDRIATGAPVLYTDSQSAAEMTPLVRKAAHTYTRVVADEAAQFQAQSDKLWDIEKGDFGLLRLPFEALWLEYKMPNVFLVDGEWRNAQPRNQRYAALIQQDGPTAWNLICLFANSDHGPVHLFPVSTAITRADDPSAIRETRRLLRNTSPRLTDQFGGELEAMQALVGCLVPAYLTIGWLNCRGISTEPSPVQHQNLRRSRKGQPLGLDYRRLVLDWRIRTSLERNQDCQREGKRLHVVRGHIRHYTAERPGFGNYVGNMWIHPHVRGDAQLGRVNHEYHVTSRGAQ